MPSWKDSIWFQILLLVLGGMIGAYVNKTWIYLTLLVVAIIGLISNYCLPKKMDLLPRHSSQIHPNQRISPIKTFLTTIKEFLSMIFKAENDFQIFVPVEGVYWLSDGGMPVSHIPSDLFTHIFYAFAKVDSQQFTISCGYTADTFTDTLRKRNPSVKTILSIGDGNPQLKVVFSEMASQRQSRTTFIDSSIEQARKYNFSGLDLVWAYPHNADEMNNYATLLAELRAKVEEEASRTRKTKLLLTAAVYYSPTINWLQATFPVESIRTNLDWVNLMAFDYYGPTWSGSTTGATAALYDPNSPVNTNHGINKWVANGLPKSKIVLGVPFYGRAWKLVNPSTDFGVGAVANGPASGPGIDGDGAISYRNIEHFIQKNHATVVYDTSLVTYYCYAGTTWISYDGIDSIDAKVSYAKSSGLLGYFAWQIGNDDAIFTLSNRARNIASR